MVELHMLEARLYDLHSIVMLSALLSQNVSTYTQNAT